MLKLGARILLLALATAASLALTACGDDSSDTSPETTAASPTTTAASGGAGSGGTGKATVDLADNQDLGSEILVDSQGRTLYLFEKDDSADESYCYDACAEAWPPLTTKGAADAGSGLDASQLTTFERDDGSTQVAYAGHPLYLYAGDSAPGDAKGNDIDQFGAEWYALDSTGSAIEDDDSSDDDSASDDTTTDDSTSEAGDDDGSDDSGSSDSGSNSANDSSSSYPSY